MTARAARLLAGLFMTTPAIAGALPEASWNRLPRWRGFNLLEKFGRDWSNGPFVEDDFKWIAGWGFNFVRLPMDYRTWIVDGDWRRFDERVLKEIDQAVAWGRKYGVHVLINFHRAPGYTVASPPEAKSLWTDPEAQEVCALHWATFARRYRGIPNRNLSFNLWNEPAGPDEATHAKVAKLAIEAIRREDPDRLIICDGLGYGGSFSEALVPLKVAQATRGYQPFTLTHYKASWVGDNADWPVPTWPVRGGASAFLYGDGKKEFQTPLVMRLGGLARPATLAFRVRSVSSRSTLIATADGREVWRHEFVCGPGKGEWTEAVFREEWQIWQNVYDREYAIPVPKGTRELALRNGEGDWMTFTEARLAPVRGGEAVLRPADMAWGSRQTPVRLEAGGFVSEDPATTYGREQLSA
ncbi:MAG: cellulase family glycosylhydrolase, partial [bacterium]